MFVVLFIQLSAHRPISISRDLKDATNPDPEIRKALAVRIRDSCINVGFFYGWVSPPTTLHPVSSSLASNHGIPESVIEQALSAAKRFFALPLSIKDEVAKPISSRRSSALIISAARYSQEFQFQGLHASSRRKH